MKSIVCLLLLLIACKPSNKLSEMVGVPKENDLTDTRWVAFELEGQSLDPDRKRPYLILKTQDTRVQGFGGCNTISGTYESSGKKLTFGQMISTRMFCEDAKDLEPQFLKVLGVVTGYSIHEHELTFYSGDTIIARFRSEGVVRE